MQAKILDYQEEQSIAKELHECGCQEVATCRYDASKDLGSPCSGDVSHGEVKLEKTDGSSSRTKRVRPPCLCSWKHMASKSKRSFPPWPLSSWAEGAWTVKWHHEQKEAWMRQNQEVQMWKQVRGACRSGDVRNP